MDYSQSEEYAVRQFAAAMLGFVKAVRTADNARLVGEFRRIATETHGSEVATLRNQPAVKPLLLNVRQAAKSLAISTGTLFNLTAPRGPIPAVKIGARVCYAVLDLEQAIERFRVKPKA
ncbi:MAG: helix-turn-helix domain-containing protein [Fimbriimonadaceae bacterium]|nr:helix-turn-helix domain-containing protein [Fimbriimonadaceae bacterium]